MTVARLRSLLLEIPGVEESESMFSSEPALWVNGKEIAHVEAGGVVDVRLTAPLIRKHRPELKGNPAVTFRKSSSADWLEVKVTTQTDEKLVVQLVTEAAAAHLPADGSPPTAPPTGSKLERMRRFH